VPTFKLSNIGRIHTADPKINPTNKTLIVSAHGCMAGYSFSPAYTTVVQFAAPSYTELKAKLQGAIEGACTAVEFASLGAAPEHKLRWYEGDPSKELILHYLAKQVECDRNHYDVLTMNKTSNSEESLWEESMGSYGIVPPKLHKYPLSGVISALRDSGLKYPSLLCLCCRVFKPTRLAFLVEEKTVEHKVRTKKKGKNKYEIVKEVEQVSALDGLRRRALGLGSDAKSTKEINKIDGTGWSNKGDVSGMMHQEVHEYNTRMKESVSVMLALERQRRLARGLARDEEEDDPKPGKAKAKIPPPPARPKP
jgi:hypothetical protein